MHRADLPARSGAVIRLRGPAQRGGHDRVGPTGAAVSHAVDRNMTERLGASPIGVVHRRVVQVRPLANIRRGLIDAPLPDPRVPIPANDHYRHFGGGQTETVLELPPGPHTLQLILGDYRHIPHNPPIVSQPVEIIVESAD